MKSALIVDFNASEDWDFYRAIQETSGEQWDLIRAVSNRYHGSKLREIKRYVRYFTVPLSVFFKRKQYKKIIAWQQFYGLILAFYCALFRVKDAPIITVMTFIYKPKKLPVIGTMYEKFIRFIIHSGYVRKFVVFSESEKEHYSKSLDINSEQVIYIKLGLEDVRDSFNCEPVSRKHFLSAGRSNRDYGFLFSAWNTLKNNGEQYSLTVICDKLHNYEDEYIAVLDDCHGEEYMRELGNCYAVILPLGDENISSGQLVILKAMMLGKPVIVTRNNTVTDYIIDGYNGYIIEKDKESLKMAIEKLENRDIYKTISHNAREYFEKNFSLYSMGVEVANVTEDNNA